MDSLITAAARALAAGDPLGALNRVALRDDPTALALRGIAMAQLGDLVRPKALLRRAARAFGPKAAVARALQRHCARLPFHRAHRRLRSAIASAQEDPGAFAGKGLRDRDAATSRSGIRQGEDG